jgi:hypothetical protein
VDEPIKESQDDYELGSWAADFLDINGGLVLTVVGVALLVSGAVLADHPAVAPFFVSFGSVLVILGTFYSRIEGGLDAGKGGVKTVIASARKRAREANLPPQAQDEAVELALERYWERQRRRGQGAPRKAAEKAVDEAIAASKQNPAVREELLLTAFEEWLFNQGFIGVDRRPGPDRGYDLAAFGRGEALLAEVKLVKRIPSRVLHELAGLSLPDLTAAETTERGPVIQLRRALVVPTGTGFTQAALDFALKARIEIYEIGEKGDVRATQTPPS